VTTHTYLSKAFLSVALLGTLLTFISRLSIFSIPASERVCRAWCSRIALGGQVHQYVGIVLFLVMAFRNNSCINAYSSGLKAFFSFKNSIRSFCVTLGNRVPQDAVSPSVRARAFGLIIAYPYAVMRDLRDRDNFGPGMVHGVLSNDDIAEIEGSPTMPVRVIEMLTELIATEIKPNVDMQTAGTLYGALAAMMVPYGECERIKQSPIVLSYIAHLRALLVAYLVTLPLALLENLGWETIPVIWVVCFALMSLEMLAVDVENPFDGAGKSDLPLNEQCSLMKEGALVIWQRFVANSPKACKKSIEADIYVEAAAPLEGSTEPSLD